MNRYCQWPVCIAAAIVIAFQADGTVSQAASRNDSAGQPKEAAEESRESRVIRQELEAMRCIPEETAPESEFEIRLQPLLSYSDPARASAAGGLWRLGEGGRPRAFIAMEYMNVQDSMEARLGIEFLSLTESPFVLEDDYNVLWRPRGSLLDFHRLQEVRSPADNERARLRQMKSMIQRFDASERHMGQRYSLRLLPQPIDRYADAGDGIVDGAVFVFAYGTNPEAIVLIECDAEGWRFAVLQSTSAELTVRFDERDVVKMDEITVWDVSEAHSANGYRLTNGELPDAD